MDSGGQAAAAESRAGLSRGGRDGPALVLGATGFLGRWVARALHARGMQLHLAARDLAALRRVQRAWGFDGEAHALDASRPGAAASLVARLQPASVWNLVGHGVDPAERDAALARRLNAELPAELAQGLGALRGEGGAARLLVHTGSALEYGKAGGDLVESTVPAPTTLYGETKLAGTEALARLAVACGVRAVTARLFTVYGPGEHPGRLLPTLAAARGGEGPIPLTAGLQCRDFAYVEDVADGLLRLAGAPFAPGEIVNLASGRLCTVREFALVAAEVLGVPETRLAFGAIPTRSEEMAHEPVAVGRLAALTGWTPPADLRAGIARAHAFAADGRNACSGPPSARECP